MSTHDPRQVVEDVRNHLAPHDRCVAFLFGAGTSSAVNIAPPPASGEKISYEPLIPGVERLTEICKAAVVALGEDQSAAWESLVKQCEQNDRSANVEDVLSKIRMKIDAIGEGERLVGLETDQLKNVEKTICSSIAAAVIPSEDKIPEKMPHDNFVDWVKKVHRTAPLEIFTTNYDILFERSFEAYRVPVFDGFVGVHQPFFYPDCLDDEELLPSPKWVRLWKLHGSVNWKIINEPTRKRIIRGQPSRDGEMILPSHRKYEESRKQPYLSYMDRLSRIANSEHGLVITSGYSFSDEDINAILFGALESRDTANIIAFQFQDLKESDHLVHEATRRSNLTVIGPNGGVISGIWGTWQLTQPVDKKTHAFMDTAFDSNALPEDEGSPAAALADLRGRMRLGDFNWFCRFLSEMRPRLQ